MTALEASQRAAWDAYLAITALLSALDGPGPDTNPHLGGVVIRIRRYAPLWGEHGHMLTAAAHSAVRLYGNGSRPELAALLQVIAHRLFLLSARRRTTGHPGYHNQRAHWNKHFGP